MKKLLIMIFACLIFIPIANASVTFEEIKEYLQSKESYLRVDGDLNEGVIYYNNNERFPLRINSGVFSFYCDATSAETEDEYSKSLEQADDCNRYYDVINNLTDFIIKKYGYENTTVNNSNYEGYSLVFGRVFLIMEGDVVDSVSYLAKFRLDLNEFKPVNNIPTIEVSSINDNKIKILVKTNNSRITKCEVYKSTDNKNFELIDTVDCKNTNEIIDEDVDLNVNSYYYKVRLEGNHDYSQSAIVKMNDKDIENNTTNTTTNNTTDNTINNTVTNTVKDNEETNENANNISDNSTASSDTEKNPETGSFLSIISVIILFAFMVGITIYTGRKKYLWRI